MNFIDIVNMIIYYLQWAENKGGGAAQVYASRRRRNGISSRVLLLLKCIRLFLLFSSFLFR